MKSCLQCMTRPPNMRKIFTFISIVTSKHCFFQDLKIDNLFLLGGAGPGRWVHGPKGGGGRGRVRQVTPG
jgi:hypothetical protein